jgi:glycosyltransferase involved in cell wall biosynthesis
MQNKRLIFILPNLCGGGAERVVLTLLWELAERGYQITLFLFKREGVYWDEVHPNIRICAVLAEGQRTRWGFPRVWLSLVQEVRHHDIVIGALEGWPTILGYFAARWYGKPCFGWVHIDLYACPTYRQNWLLQKLLFWVYSRLNEVVFVSTGARDSATRWIDGKHNFQCCVIHNAIRLSESKLPSTEQIREPLHVIAVGRLSTQKGFDLLIRAHAKLISDGQIHHLTIYGIGNQKPALQNLIHELLVAESVSLPGFANDISLCYSQADVFVLSSRFEGFGMVIVEAMAHGVPVVATDCPSGPREILADGKYGELIPSENVDALAEGIRRLLTDTKYREHLSKVGKQRAEDFSVGRIADEWEVVFRADMVANSSSVNL